MRNRSLWKMIWLLVLVTLAACDKDKTPSKQTERTGRAVRVELAGGSVLVGTIQGAGTYTIRLNTRDEVIVEEQDIVRIEYLDTPSPVTPPKDQKRQEGADLRFAGSNTVGETLVPELVQAYLIDQILRRPDGQPEHESRIEVGDTTKAHTLRTVHIAAHGTKTGFEALGEDKADVGMASSRITGDWLQKLAGKGDLTSVDSEHIIALDGLAIIVHPRNTKRELTIEQIARIFGAREENGPCLISDWSKVGGRSGRPNLHARDAKSGTWESFKRMVLEPYGLHLCDGAKRYESSTDLSNAVTADPQGIGFIGLPYILNARALDITEDSRNGLVYRPTVFSVRSEEYPLTRRLYLYTPKEPTSRFTNDFIRFILAEEGQKAVNRTGFVSLGIDRDVNDTQRARWEAAERMVQNRQMLSELRQATSNAVRLSVTFRFNSAEADLDTLALRDLDRLARFMQSKEAEGRDLLLLGFADSDGNYAENLRLSQDRVDAVVGGLRTGGRAPVVARGFSEEAPVASNDNELGRQRNRRVEAWLR